MEYLYPNFLEDTRQYSAAQAVWRTLCEQVLDKHHQSSLWRPWFDDVKLDDGSILQDGNPIYSLVNWGELKGVTIVQHDPHVHTKWEMTAFVDMFGDEHSKPGPINNLVFTCNLSQESASAFEKLFEIWVQPEIKTQDIEKMIKNLGIG